jgi:hypothetical protein
MIYLASSHSPLITEDNIGIGGNNMAILIKEFADGSILEYDKGKFDDWCVYVSRPNQRRYAPTDIGYFTSLKDLSNIHGAGQLYQSFVAMYNRTTSDLSGDTLNYISEVCGAYGVDALELDILFTIIYAGMVAEERKENTKLGKRIKRLGMHQLLVEGMAPGVAANFSRGMRWYDISNECQQRGF